MVEIPLPVPSQYMGGGPSVKRFTKGVVWWRGKMTYFRFSAMTSFKRCFARMAPLPKYR